MLKICAYCGKIHDRKYECRKKKEAVKKRRKKASDAENCFRWSGAWKRKAEQIKKRDKYLCQACIREIKGTVRKYNPNGLSVHHIIALRVDFDRRLDDDNLITLCRMHHDDADAGRIPAEELGKMAKEQTRGG